MLDIFDIFQQLVVILRNNTDDPRHKRLFDCIVPDPGPGLALTVCRLP